MTVYLSIIILGIAIFGLSIGEFLMTNQFKEAVAALALMKVVRYVEEKPKSATALKVLDSIF